MSTDTCGSDTAANSLFGNLVNETEFSIPAVDLSGTAFQIPDLSDDPLFDAVGKIDIETLTTGVPGGSGMFDALMKSNRAHLQEEHAAGRLTNAAYSEAYVAMTTAVLSASVQYLLSKDQAYYQAALAQSQAKVAKIGEVQARVQLEESKARLVEQQLSAKARAAQYAYTKIQIAAEDARRCLTQAQEDQIVYETLNLMPKRVAQLTAEITMLETQTDKVVADTRLSESQKLSVDKEVEVRSYQLTALMPAELTQTTSQTSLIDTQKLKVDEDITLVSAQKLAVDKDVAVKDYQLVNLLPKELEMATTNISKVTADKDQVLYQTANILPEQLNNIVADKNQKVYQTENLLPAQKASVTKDTETKAYTLSYLLPSQLELSRESVEAARAKTLDTRTDGTTLIAGSIGKQKELHNQQIESYQRDAEWKVAKGLIDTWITGKSMDENYGDVPAFSQGSIDSALASIRTKLSI